MEQTERKRERAKLTAFISHLWILLLDRFYKKSRMSEDIMALTTSLKSFSEDYSGEFSNIFGTRQSFLRTIKYPIPETLKLAETLDVCVDVLLDRHQTINRQALEIKQLTPTISKFYTHLRILNHEHHAIDFFEYDICQDRFLFSYGISNFSGGASQIHFELDGIHLFEEYQCEIIDHFYQSSLKTFLQSHTHFVEQLKKSIQENTFFQVFLRLINTENQIVWLKVWIETGNTAVSTVVKGAMQNVSDEARQSIQEHQNRLKDTITGFYQRDALAEIGPQFLASRKPDEAITFFYFSLKNQQMMDAQFGALGGIEYIKSFAALAKNKLNEKQIVFRWLGASFLSIFKGFQSIEEIKIAGKQMIDALAATTNELQGVTVNYPINAGFSIAGVHGQGCDDLFDKAVFACMEVSSGVADNMNEFSQKRFDAHRHRIIQRSLLKGLIEANELTVVFQAIISLVTGQIIGYEALSRPTTQIYSNIHEVIRDAAQTDHYAALENRMILNALEIYSKRPEILQDKMLFLNMDPRFIISDEVCKDLQERYFQFIRVVVEMSKPEFPDYQFVQAFQKKAKEFGTQFSIDHYTLQFDNELSVNDLQPDIIKIDRNLVHEIDTNLKNQRILHSIIQRAVNERIQVFAVGVETENELSTLRKMGIHAAQGYYISPPLPGLCESSQEVKNFFMQLKESS